jgi:signal peptidase I
MKETIKKRKTNPIISISAGIIIGLICKLFVFDAVIISGPSMEPLLSDGQLVLLHKLSYGIVIPFTSDSFIRWSSPQLDDVVYYLHDSKIVIKRCVGVENEALSFYSNKGYYVVIDNNTARTIPLNEKQYQRLKNTSIIPPGYIFAVGDNYDESVDSRDYGFVFASHVPGKAACR